MNESTVRRLGFAKYLYHLAVEQSRAPEPMGAAAVLTLHDAVELFLQIASEHVNAGGSQQFMDYWEEIGKRLTPEVLPQKESMRRLNKARVALKHHGTLPARLDIDAFRATVTAFLQESTPLVFGIEFEAVSLSAFVSPANARREIERAAVALENGEVEAAINSAALALELVISDYEHRKGGFWGQSPFSFGDRTRFSPFDLSDLERNDRRAARVVRELVDSVEELQRGMKILALAVDYRRYARFQLVAPYVSQTMDGTYHFSPKQNGADLTQDDARFAVNFVLDASIRILDFDYDVPEGVGGRRSA